MRKITNKKELFLESKNNENIFEILFFFYFLPNY